MRTHPINLPRMAVTHFGSLGDYRNHIILTLRYNVMVNIANVIAHLSNIVSIVLREFARRLLKELVANVLMVALHTLTGSVTLDHYPTLM
jgi:uncharacterized membrane protein